MQQQVITIGADGQVAGLQRKKGQGVDLRQFGDAEIVRASEIVFHAPTQEWEIHVLQGELAGKVLTYPLVGLILGTRVSVRGKDLTVRFGDYDDAVKMEVAVLDALRIRGSIPAS